MKWKIKHPRGVYWIYYTAIFLITIIGFYFSFLYNQKSFIWNAETKDGLTQHYNALMYYGRYLRSIIKNIFVSHQFVLPMWDFSIGYGADILTTLHYYVIGDPLNLLSVFVPMRYTEYLYMFLIILRLYLAGIAFSCYAFYMKQNRKATLLGSLTYVFCGYTIFTSVRHPYFINPMIYLPLMAIGIEKVFDGKSAKMFILSVALAAISNFYFFYMLCLLIIIYAIIRYLSIYGFKDLKNLWKLFAKCLGYAFIAIMMASIILIPVVFLFLNSSRTTDHVVYDSIYSLSYYLSMFLNFHSFHSCGYTTYCSFSAISVLSIFLLFINRHKYRTICIAFFIITALLCIPFVGYMFNGFSYLSNRWCFGYAFMVGIVVCWTFQDFLACSRKQMICLGIVALLWFLLSLLFQETRNMNHIISCFIMFIIYIVLYFRHYLDRKISLNIFYVCIIFLNVMSISVNAFFKYSPSQSNYVKQFVDLGQGYSMIEQTRAEAMNYVSDSDFYRYDETSFGNSYLFNSALQQKQYSLSFFYSLGSGYITDYFQEMGNLNALSSKYSGVDNRRYLQALAAVKYYVCQTNQMQYVPYDFNDEVYTSDQYSIYQADEFLPLGYTYDSQISKEEYALLSPLKKQQALLQSVCIEGDLSLQTSELTFADQSTSYQIDSSYGLEKTTNGFRVNSSDAYVILKFEGEKNSELYVDFLNLQLVPTKNSQGNYISKANITLESEGISNTIVLRNQYNTYYNGTLDFLVHLGYTNEARNEIKITFKTVGEYICDDIVINHLSMNHFSDQINARKEDILENVEVNTNEITGQISLDSEKFLCLSIPYSEGWHLYVDGEEEELYRANTMYMGTLLNKGDHEIRLVYETPFLRIGGLISLSGVVLFVIVIFYEKKKLIKNFIRRRFLWEYRK